MMNRALYLIILLYAFACQPKEEQEQDVNWIFEKELTLEQSIHPLSLAKLGDTLWVSDPDNQRVVAVDSDGNIIHEIPNQNRPMHIEMSGQQLLIPNMAIDSIFVYEQNKIKKMVINDSLDAPSGISGKENVIAIADFYNHRILVIANGKTTVIGSKGHADGLLNYPTDVKLYEDKVMVADAYNNRIQVFDRQGNFLKVIGWQEDIKVAAGVDVYNDLIYITDYYGNRLLMYDFEGKLFNVFEEHFNKPTDVLVTESQIYVSNYGGSSISVLSRK